MRSRTSGREKQHNSNFREAVKKKKKKKRPADRFACFYGLQARGWSRRRQRSDEPQVFRVHQLAGCDWEKGEDVIKKYIKHI